LYGRFKGSTRPAAMVPPASTLALNPYLRPQTALRAGETPRGAQLLSAVRQAPGGGRDLYASPDGDIYRRKNDGWYRRSPSGNWSFFAPLQGKVEGDRVVAARDERSAGSANRGAAEPGKGAARRQAAGDRVPDIGSEARAQEVADLERQYYARSIAQARAQQ